MSFAALLPLQVRTVPGTAAKLHVYHVLMVAVPPHLESLLVAAGSERLESLLSNSTLCSTVCSHVDYTCLEIVPCT